MLRFNTYLPAKSLQEAYEANQKRSAVILGGMGWLKQGGRTVATGIDLSGLGLDTIVETPEEFAVGAMVTLRQLERHESIDRYTAGAMKNALRHIVGNQFRACATVGGTVWARLGFSDPLTLLLVLDAEVELYHAGRIRLADFMKREPDNDVLTCLYVKKTPLFVAYEAFRNTETDLPVLTCAVAKTARGWRSAVGARPGRARLVAAASLEELKQAAQRLPYGTNLRATEEYRRHLSGILLEHCARAVREDRT